MKFYNIVKRVKFARLVDYLFFIGRLVYFKIKYGNLLSLSSFTVSLESNVELIIKSQGNMLFGDFVYIKRNGNIEVYDRGFLTLGSNVFINKNVTLVCRSSISIGNNCMFGENVSIYDHNHCFYDKTVPFNKQGFETRPVVIGDNVWVGSGVFICPGVTIGENSVIAAGTVVCKDVPAGTVLRQKIDYSPLG